MFYLVQFVIGHFYCVVLIEYFIVLFAPYRVFLHPDELEKSRKKQMDQLMAQVKGLFYVFHQF